MDILKCYGFKRKCFQKLKGSVEERTCLEINTRKNALKKLSSYLKLVLPAEAVSSIIKMNQFSEDL